MSLDETTMTSPIRLINVIQSLVTSGVRVRVYISHHSKS